jgi:hypothetical protein
MSTTRNAESVEAHARKDIANKTKVRSTDRAVKALASLLDTETRGSSFDLDAIVTAAVAAEECRWWAAVQTKLDNGEDLVAAITSVAGVATRQLLSDARSASSGPSGGAHRLFDMGVKTEGAARFLDEAEGMRMWVESARDAA